MKLHLTQKIGIGGIAFVSLIAMVFYFGGCFSPFIFAISIPFCVLILIGHSINNSRKIKNS
ncbi:MAG: hypothetical protein COB15_07225 [Flavobacteriales bacterium]|nr:MAG: hypothetical protein COB15_07225 [Flavobacteriales bacterium]